MPSKFKHEPLCGTGISAILIFLDILVTRYNLITLVPIELEQKFRQILKALVKSINLKYSKGSKGSRKKAREPSSLFYGEPFEPLEARVNP